MRISLPSGFLRALTLIVVCFAVASGARAASTPTTGAVAAGGNHTLVLKSDGSVWTWGTNSSGQLGDGTTIKRLVPQPVTSLSGVAAVAAGRSHSLALKTDGTVWSWGSNAMNQIGDGTDSNRKLPVQVTGLAGVTAIAAGDYHSIALQSDGTVWAWGANDYGQLGADSNEVWQQATPAPIPGLPPIVAIASSLSTTLLLAADGKVWSVGNTSFTAVEVAGLEEVVALAAGDSHAIAVKADGSVWTWGSNGLGQLGNGTTTDHLTPTQVAGLPLAAAVAARGAYSVALTRAGEVWTWGANYSGVLGDGTTTSRSSPQPVTNLGVILGVSAGPSSVVVVRNDGSVLAWGSKSGGQGGDGGPVLSTYPVQAAGFSNVVAVAGAGTRTLALRSDGTVVQRGSSVPGLNQVIAIAASTSHNAVVRSDGTVWGWGNNGSGQLGTGNTVLATVPVQALGLNGATAIGVGLDHTLARKSDGTVWAWGGNGSGQLGDGTKVSRSTPVRSTVVSTALAIAAGWNFSVALKPDGTVVRWGLNGTLQAAGMTGVVAIAAGDNHILMLKSDGTVWAWGANQNGQAGTGVSGNYYTNPVRVSGLTGVVAIAAGSTHSMALTSDGSLWSWGANSNGQLGDGTYVNRLTPVRAAGLAGCTAISPGAVVTAGGSVWTFGDVMALSPGAFGVTQAAIRLTASTADSDADGMADAWEVQYFGDLTRNGGADGDLDGLTDMQEAIRGSDPTSADPDGDGFTDFADPFPHDMGEPPATVLTLLRDGAPAAGLAVDLYDDQGVFAGTSLTSDVAGVARFTLGTGRRFVLVIACDGRRIATAPQTAPASFSFNLPPTTTVSVTKAGVPQTSKTVRLLDADGLDLDYPRSTDETGRARFCIDAGRVVKFAADDAGAQRVTLPSTAPANVAFELDPEIRPVLAAATLQSAALERGVAFEIAVSGEHISGGTLSLDFLSAQGGGTLVLPLTLRDATWIAAGRTPADVPLPLDGAGSVVIPATIALQSSAGLTASATASFTLINDSTPPSIALDQPLAATVATAVVTLTGAVSPDTTELRLTAPDSPTVTVPFDAADGRFSLALSLAEGLNHHTLTARDLVGNQAQATLAYTRSSPPPVIVLTSPVAGASVNSTSIRVAGTVTAAGAVTLTVNGVSVAVAAGGAFERLHPLSSEGANTVTVAAEDAYRRKATQTLTVYRLTQAPSLALTSPSADPFVTRLPVVQLVGTVGSSATQLLVNGTPVADFASGVFTHPVPLSAGNNAILVEARDAGGNVQSLRRTVILDQVPPTLAALTPVDGFVTNSPSLTVQGRVVDGQSLMLNGAAVPLATDGAFTRTLTLAEGATTLTLEAADAAGNVLRRTLTVTLDTIAPVVSISAPLAGATVTSGSVAVTGRVDDPAATLTLNTAALANTGGTFSGNLTLSGHDATITVQARDAAGNLGAKTVTVRRDATAPTLAFTAPANGSSTRASVVRVAGTVDDPAATVTVNGRSALVAAGQFELPDFPLVEGQNVLSAVATDALGNSSAPVTLTVTSDRSAPATPTLPTAQTYIKTDRLTVQGSAEPGAVVTISGGLAPVTTTADGTGAFAALVLVTPNRTTSLFVRTVDGTGNESEPFVLTVVSDTVAPVVSLSRPTAAASLRTSVVDVLGTVADQNPGATVTVNNQSVPLLASTQFGARLSFADGAQTITVTATDLAGNQTQVTRPITVTNEAGDDAPPVIAVLTPAYDAVVPSPVIAVTALVTDESPLTAITLGGTPVTDADGDGVISGEVTVDANGQFTVTATDAQNLTQTLTHRVQVDTAPPPAPTLQRISPESPTAEFHVVLYGSAAPGLRYEIAGGLLAKQTGVVGSDGKFSATVPLVRNTTNHLQVVVLGANGLASAPATADVVQDATAPAVDHTVPATAAVVAPDAPIQVVFTEAMRNSELASVQLQAGAASVTAARSLSADGLTLTLTPASPLPEGATVRVTLPATLSDLAGNPLGAAYSFVFSIRSSSIPAAPVVDALPAQTSETQIAVAGSATAYSRITVSGGAAPATATADAQGRFVVAVSLQSNTVNALSVVAVTPAGSTSPARAISIVQDSQAFALTSSVPADGAHGIAANTLITLGFNRAVDAASVAGVALVGPSIVPSSVTVSSSGLSVLPLTPLAPGVRYEVVVPASIADVFGDRLGATRRLAFTTDAGDSPTVSAPIVYTAQPTGNTSRTTATLTGYSAPGTELLVSGGNAPFTSAPVDATGLFTLEIPLQANAANTLELRARDAAGNLSTPVTALQVRQDSVAPAVLRSLPAHGATNVDAHDAVFVEFSETVQAGPLTAALPALRLFDAQNVVVAGKWIPSADGRSATFYPTSELAAQASFKVLVGTDVRDLAGNALAAPVEIDFTTGAASSAGRPATPVLDPLASTRTTAATITLNGTAPAGGQLRVFGGAGAASATVAADGRFSVVVPLIANSANPLAVIAEVGGTPSLPATITITQVKQAAALRLLSPQPGLTYHNRSVTVTGIVDDPDAITGITVAGAKAALAGRYFFCQAILDPAPGTKSLTAVAALKNGSTLEASVTFSLLVEPAGTDTHPPIPRFIFPEDGDVLNGEVVETLLTVEEGVQLSSVEIDRVVAHQVVGNIFFILARPPQQGANTITVTATDAAGLVGTASVNVTIDSVGFATAPTVVAVPSLTNDRVITLSGTAEPGATIVVVNGLVPVRTVVDASGTWSVAVPLNPNTGNRLSVVATDAAGNVSPAATVDLVHDDARPTIVSTSPASGQSGVAQNATVEVTFSEALNPASVTADGAVVVRSALGQAITRNVLLSADGKTLRIVPSYKFLRGDTITVDLAASIADTHGFAVGTPHSFNFATAAYRTTVSGIVIDPQLRPLAGVKVGLAGTSRSQTTSSFGTFLLDDAPVGDGVLYVDGRPDPATGVHPQGDARVFGYLEFALPVRQDVDNSLGRPIFLVETDLSTASTLALTGESNELTFTPAEKDLAGFSITYRGGSARFADGTQRGQLTATRIDAAHLPDRLPSGAIPHFLVEIGPDGLTFDTPAQLAFPNVYDLAVGAEVIVFHFKYGIRHYAELGRAVVGADHRIHTGALLKEAGFVGIVPADKSVDLTRTYLAGRVVDASGTGLAGIPVNAIAGGTTVVTDAAGNYSIPLPEVRLLLIRTFATVSTDLGSRSGDSPSLVFPSDLVAVNASGVTTMPDIVVDSFFLGGNIRYLGADGARLPVTGLAYDQGRLVSVDEVTARSVEIFVYRRLSAPGALPVYDSQPYMTTNASLDRLDDAFDASYSLSFLGSLATSAGAGGAGAVSQTPKPGDVIKLVAFDRKTGFYAESDFKLPAAAEANGGDTPLDVLVDLELRPPVVSLDINRVFFLDGVRRRTNVPHGGIAFTSDEFVEFKTTWVTPVATPLDRPELALPARLRVNSIDYQTDYGFTVRGGEHFRVLELREGVVSNRLTILQRDTDVGVETIAVSRDGSFADASLLPLQVKTDSYGLAQTDAAVAATAHQKVELNILDLKYAAGGDGLDISGRTLPGQTVTVAGVTFTADAQGYFGRRVSGAGTTGGVPVSVGDGVETRHGEALTPVINALTATPAGLVPRQGAQGTSVAINGAHFSPVASDNKVSFHGAAAVVQSATETQLVVLVPDLASSGDVTVTIGGKKSNGVHFEFLSVGINNGSFEDGTLRAFTIEGSGRVVERWNRLTPTDRQYMAFLDTMEDPRDGVSTLMSDAFEVPAGMQTLLFEYNFLATALLRPASDCLDFYIVTDATAIKVADLFATLTTEINSPISGYDEASGFRTAGVDVRPWAGTGARIRVRVVLKGRGALPDFIPGMNPDDHNPIGLGNNPGTGLLLDSFRLSNGYETPPPSLDAATVTLVSTGAVATLTLAPGALAPDSRVYVWNIATGDLTQLDVGGSGGISLTAPFDEGDSSVHFLISYATPAGPGGGARLFSPPLKLGVVR